MKESAKLLNENQIFWSAHIIFGFPGENEQTLSESEQFLDDLFADANIAIPVPQMYMIYPGSHVYFQKEEYEQLGTRFYFPDWYRYPINSRYLSKYIDPSKELNFTDQMNNIESWWNDFRIPSEERLNTNHINKIALNFFKIYLKTIDFKPLSEEQLNLAQSSKTEFWNKKDFLFNM